jgi:hypothetical protein
MQHRIETDGRRWLSEPEPYTGCSALEEEEKKMSRRRRRRKRNNNNNIWYVS